MSSHLLVQISDVHLTADGLFSGHGQLDPPARPRDQLVAGLALLDKSGIKPDVFLMSGDLADAGDQDSYADVAAIMTETASRSGASVVFLPGNHDDRASFRHVFAIAGQGPVNQTCWHDGLRIVALDSTIPGESGGALADETIAYLRSELSSPARAGTVVALHHPPIPSPIEPMSRIALREPGRLREVLAGSDVRLVLCGHYHHEALGMLGQVPVWVSPACAYRLDVTNRVELRGRPGSAFSRVDLTDDGLTVTAIPVA